MSETLRLKPAPLESAIAEILDVYVCSQPDVVRQVPAVMIGIFVDHDIVGIPEPVIAVAYIVRRHRKIESTEPEAARASALNVKHVALAKAAGKMSVLPGMIKMVVRVILPGIMPHPFVTARMDVWRRRVSFFIDVRLGLLRSASLLRRCDVRGRSFSRRCRCRMRHRAVRGNVSSANSAHTAAG